MKGERDPDAGLSHEDATRLRLGIVNVGLEVGETEFTRAVCPGCGFRWVIPADRVTFAYMPCGLCSAEL